MSLYYTGPIHNGGTYLERRQPLSGSGRACLWWVFAFETGKIVLRNDWGNEVSVRRVTENELRYGYTLKRLNPEGLLMFPSLAKEVAA